MVRRGVRALAARVHEGVIQRDGLAVEGDGVLHRDGKQDGHLVGCLVFDWWGGGGGGRSPGWLVVLMFVCWFVDVGGGEQEGGIDG